MNLELIEKISIIFFLYFLQGFILGSILSLSPIVLSKVYSISSIAQFSFIAAFPFSIKLLLSPISDLFSLPVIKGKRGWLIFTQVFLIPLFLILKVSYLSLSKVPLFPSSPVFICLSICSFLTIFLLALKDISLDSFCLRVFSKESQSHYGSICQLWGQSLGELVATTSFFGLTDLYETNISSHSSFLIKEFSMFLSFVPFLLLFGCLFTFFPNSLKIRENSIFKTNNRKAMLSEYFSHVKQILTNKNTKDLFFILITYRIGVAYFQETMTLKILEMGFKETFLNKVSVFVVFFNIFMTLKYKDKIEKDCLKFWLDSFIRFTKVSFVLLLFITFVDSDPTKPSHVVKVESVLTKFGRRFLFGGFTIYKAPINLFSKIVTKTFMNIVNSAFFVTLIVLGTLSNMMFLAMFGFMSKVCDDRIGGTYITVFASMMNFSSFFANFIVLKIFVLLNKNIFLVCLGSVIYSGIWLFLFEKRVMELREKPLGSWSLI